MRQFLLLILLTIFALDAAAYAEPQLQFSVAGKNQACAATTHELHIRPYQAGQSENIEFLCRDKIDPNNFLQILAEKIKKPKGLELKLVKAEYSQAKKNKIPEVSGGFTPQKASGFFKIANQKNSKNIKGEFSLLLLPEHSNNPKNKSRLKISGTFSYASE